MSNLDKEIADALAKVERLKEKKRVAEAKERVAEAKERARFADAIMSILDEIENAEQRSVERVEFSARVRW